jgi:hypothetical protein
MNRYYINADGNAFAIRCTGIAYKPAAGETRIPSDKALRTQARLGMIPTYIVKFNGSRGGRL